MTPATVTLDIPVVGAFSNDSPDTTGESYEKKSLTVPISIDTVKVEN